MRKLKHYYCIVFVKYKYKYLFEKDEPVDEKYLIKMINKDLKHNYKINQISSNIKSHSFRINIIAKLLKNTSVQNTANIIGHRDIKSTMAYKRYALNKKKIQELLNKTLLKQDFIYYFYSLKDVFCQLEFYHFKF